MFLSIDHDSSLPLHAQIAQGVQLAIANGKLEVGDRLPTVRQLAVDLRVNSNTVARVYQELEREGLVETQRGLGTFVAKRAKLPPMTREKMLAALCKEFVQLTSTQGFSLKEVRKALRDLDSDMRKDKSK